MIEFFHEILSKEQSTCTCKRIFKSLNVSELYLTRKEKFPLQIDYFFYIKIAFETLTRHISKDFLPYLDMVPISFYSAFCCLKDRDFVESSVHLARQTNNIIYKRLSLQVRNGLKNGRTEDRKYRVMLVNHIDAVTTLMTSSTDYYEFLEKLDNEYPMYCYLGDIMIIYDTVDFIEDTIKFSRNDEKPIIVKICSILNILLETTDKKIITAAIRYNNDNKELQPLISVKFKESHLLYKLIDALVLQQELDYSSSAIFPTKSGQRVYSYISDYIHSNKIAPTHREIAKGIGIQSCGVISRWVEQLVAQGFIIKNRNGKRNLIPVPLCELRQEGEIL